MTRLTRVALLFAIAILASACESPDQAWRNAQAADTVEAYEKFVADHPDSPQHAEALQKIDLLRKTAIHRAARAGNRALVESLLASGVGVNASEGAGATPLHFAAACRPEIVGLLLSKKAEVSAVDDYGATPLHHAAYAGCLEAMKLLLEAGADVKAEVQVGATMFVVEQSVVKVLGGPTPGIKGTPLHWAAAAGKADAVQLLISKGAVVDSINGWGESPLHLAAESGDLPTVQTLLKHGAVAQYGSEFDDRYPTKSGQPLHYARSVPVVEELVAHGAKIDVRTENTGMPIHAAARHGYNAVVDYYLSKGIDANVRATWNAGSSWASEVTPLWTAAKFGHLDTVQLLVKHNGDLKFKTAADESGGGLLHAAAVTGNPALVTYLLDQGLPIDDRADVSTERTLFQPLHQMTPLAVAAFFGRRAAAEILLARGANIRAEVNGNWDILDLALKTDDRDMVRFLLEKGAPLEATVDDIKSWRVSDEMKATLTAFLKSRGGGGPVGQ